MNTPGGMLPTIALGILGLLATTGCSIAMALHGNPEPNFQAFEVGSTRKQVEIQLGAAQTSETLESGKRRDTYRYEIGNAPNGHRALMNLYIDLATLFLYEIPGTVIEAKMGHWEESQIIYDRQDRVLEIHGYRPPPPSSVEQASQEAQKQFAHPPPAGQEKPAQK